MDIQTVKITNPHWLTALAPQIERLANKLKIPGIYSQNLAAYFYQTIQYGEDKAEFWVAMEKDEPIAFAHFYVRGLPYIGTVSLDYIHSWTKNQKATDELFKKLNEFAKKHRSTLIYGETASKGLARYYKQVAGRFKYDMLETGIQPIIAKAR